MKVGRRLFNASDTPLLVSASIIGLLLVRYVPLLLHWIDGWINKSISTEHEYFSYGLIGFPFAGYIVWTARKDWQQLPDKTNLLGLALLGLGVWLYLSNLTNLINFSLPTILTGICLWFKGIPGLKLQQFPLLLVWLATPNDLPYLIAPYTVLLQKFIAGAVGFILI